MPVDSVNSLNGALYPTQAEARTYFYYCYPDVSWIEPNSATVRAGYVSDKGAAIYRNFVVQNCLTNLPS